MNRFISLCFFLILSTSLIAQTNEGTDFWVGFMDHIDNDNEMVVMITAPKNTSGKIEMPHKNWSADYVVQANKVTVVKLPLSAETTTSEQNDNTGIHVTATSPVSVYAHQYHNARSEAAMILPVASLGDEYFVMSYKGIFQLNQVWPSQFMAVAIEDDTEILIEVSDNTKEGKLPRTVSRPRLDKGETYQVQAAGQNDDLTGSWLRANKPFALFGGVSWTEVPTGCDTRDNLYEQMYPVSTWGKEFIMAPNALADYDVVRILASENNTRVFIDNNQVANLDRGEHFTTNIYGRPAYIKGTKTHPGSPIQYWQ